jgi:glycerol-3-phosphate acyltransferase PlsY
MGRIEWNIPIALLILWVFVTYRHRENIVRIKNGTENKIGRKKE